MFFIESGRTIPGHTKGSKIMRVFITDGRGEKFNGTLVYFTKTKVDVDISLRNFGEVGDTL